MPGFGKSGTSRISAFSSSIFNLVYKKMRIARLRKLLLQLPDLHAQDWDLAEAPLETAPTVHPRLQRKPRHRRSTGCGRSRGGLIVSHSPARSNDSRLPELCRES